MKTVLKWIAGAITALLLLAALGLLGARFADGPIAIIAGGPFTSGELVTGPEPDWSFVRDVQEVQFQLLEPARSRTTWITEHEGRIYIPSGYMNSVVGRLWKHWPYEAERDGRVLLRVDGKLYERRLVRLSDGPLAQAVARKIGNKYLGGAEGPPDIISSGDLWLFEVAPRS